MSTPEEKSTDTPANVEKSGPTPEEQIAIANQRVKDTQASYTKGQQALKASEAVNQELRDQIAGLVQVTLTPEEQESLDTLKYEDPDAWRVKVNALETEAKAQSKEKLDEVTTNARTKAGDSFELERRQQVLKSFNESAEVAITEELIANDVPPRITKKLAEGTISFEEFLDEVTTHLGKGVAVHNEDTLDQPNLGAISGSQTPVDAKPEKSLEKSYSTQIF